MINNHKVVLLKSKSELLKAIAHPMRLCILNCLMHDEACNVTQLAEKMETAQSTVSQHLSKMRTLGIIEGTRNGVEMNYKVVNHDIEAIIHVLLDEALEHMDD